MSDIIKEKMEFIGDYCLDNKSRFKRQLDFLLKPINNINGEDLPKDLFRDIFSNLHMQVLYIDAMSLDFICGDKIIKMLFNKPLFKDHRLTSESGDIFKIEQHQDKRCTSIYTLSSLKTLKVFFIIDFKCLEHMKIFDNDNSEITDIYYGGLFKLKEFIEKQEEVKPSEQSNSSNNGSLFHKETNSKPIVNTEEKSNIVDPEPSKDYKYLEIKEDYKVKINPFELIEDDFNKVYTKNMSEYVLNKAIRTINFIYNTTVKEIDFAVYLIEDRLNSLNETIMHAICILRDENATYVLEIDADGGIKITLDLIANVKDIVFHLHRVLRRNSLNNDLRERNNFRYKSF